MDKWIIVIPKNERLSKFREVFEKIKSFLNIDKYDFLEVRGEDVPLFVTEIIKKGNKSIGITGEDLFKEFQLEKPDSNLSILRRFSWIDKEAIFEKPALCLLGPKNKTLDNLPKKLRVCIADKYKKIAKHYLNMLESKGFVFEKMYVSGATEKTFLYGISDLVIDIVYSGKSAKEAGLEVYDKIFECDIVVIGDKKTMPNTPQISFRPQQPEINWLK